MRESNLKKYCIKTLFVFCLLFSMPALSFKGNFDGEKPRFQGSGELCQIESKNIMPWWNKYFRERSCEYIKTLSFDETIFFNSKTLEEKFFKSSKNDIYEIINERISSILTENNRGELLIEKKHTFPRFGERSIRYSIMFFSAEGQDYPDGAILLVEVVPSSAYFGDSSKSAPVSAIYHRPHMFYIDRKDFDGIKSEVSNLIYKLLLAGMFQI